jgi:putative flippase GtrA
VVAGLGTAGGWRARLWLMARYALSGAATIGVYMIVYNALVVASPVPRFAASNIAYVCALLVQFSAHRLFTFGHRETGEGTLVRYLVSVGFGALLAAGISEANTRLYTLDDTAVSAIVMGLVACTNFVLFNLWVYRHRPQSSPGP